MPRPAIVLAFAGVVSAAALLATPAFAQTAPQVPQRTLSLTGQSEVKSAPDIAVISAGVVSEAKTAREALTLNNEAMASVLQTIEAAGVAKKDIQTSSFSVQPKYKYSKRSSSGEQEPPRITGYTVSNSVTVIARDLAKLGPVLDAVVSSGVNQMNGLSFSIAEPEPLRNEARKMAVTEARARAEMYAEAAGVSLGKILSISEAGGQRPPQPEYRRAALQSTAADSVPIAQGQQSIQMQVNIVWEIE
ncbi:MAG: SIMPL domain-containing protein [Anderseniella sp.]